MVGDNGLVLQPQNKNLSCKPVVSACTLTAAGSGSGRRQLNRISKCIRDENDWILKEKLPSLFIVKRLKMNIKVFAWSFALSHV